LVTDGLARLVGVLLFLGQVDDGDVGTLPGEQDGDGPADAGVAAGDEGGLALELAGAGVQRCLVAGPRLHLVLVARGRLRLRRHRRLGFVLPFGHGSSSRWRLAKQSIKCKCGAADPRATKTPRGLSRSGQPPRRGAPARTNHWTGTAPSIGRVRAEPDGQD